MRVLHPASFRDDPTRVFRAARFMARLKYAAAPGLVDSAKAALPHARTLSPHRLLHELDCLLDEKDPGPAFDLLKKWGYLGLLGDVRYKGLPAGVEPRLAALALALGAAKGKAFVDAFPHEHRRRTRLHEILALAFCDRAPRSLPEPAVAAAVRRFLPKLPAVALKPCFLTGADLIAAGQAPGPEFHKILDESARLQRAGKLKSRAAALARLKKG